MSAGKIYPPMWHLAAISQHGPEDGRLSPRPVELASEFLAVTVPMPTSLAEIVIVEGLVEADGLSRAVESSDAAREPIVVSLVREEGIDEVALVAALKKHSRIKVLDPAKVEYDHDALRELHRDDCRRLRAVPLSLQLFGAGPRVLGVAMADPTDAVGVAELEHLSGCAVEPVLVTLSAVEEMIETAYKHAVTEVMRRADSLSDDSAPQIRSKKPAFKKPKTTPFHRLSDEAGPLLRAEALLNICLQKQLFTEEEYEETLATLMKSKRATKAKKK